MGGAEAAGGVGEATTGWELGAVSAAASGLRRSPLRLVLYIPPRPLPCASKSELTLGPGSPLAHSRSLAELSV